MFRLQFRLLNDCGGGGGVYMVVQMLERWLATDNMKISSKSVDSSDYSLSQESM